MWGLLMKPFGQLLNASRKTGLTLLKKTNRTQMDFFYSESRNIGLSNALFQEFQKSNEPITHAEYKRLAAMNPRVWSKFSKYFENEK